MGWLKNMSLKKAFLAIITASILAAIAASFLFGTFCNTLIDHFDLYVTVPVADESDFCNDEITDNTAIVIEGGTKTQTTYYYTHAVEPGYTILSTLRIVMPVVFVIVALIYADLIFYRVKLKKPIDILRNSAQRI